MVCATAAAALALGLAWPGYAAEPGKIILSEQEIVVGSPVTAAPEPPPQRPAPEPEPPVYVPIEETAPIEAPADVYREAPTPLPANEPAAAPEKAPADTKKEKPAEPADKKEAPKPVQEPKEIPAAAPPPEPIGWRRWLPGDVKEGEEMTFLALLALVLGGFFAGQVYLAKRRNGNEREESRALKDAEQVSEAFLEGLLEHRPFEDVSPYLHQEMLRNWGAMEYTALREQVERDFGQVEGKRFYSFHRFGEIDQLIYMAACSKVPVVQIGFNLKPSPRGAKICAFLFVPPNEEQ